MRTWPGGRKRPPCMRRASFTIWLAFGPVVMTFGLSNSSNSECYGPGPGASSVPSRNRHAVVGWARRTCDRPRFLISRHRDGYELAIDCEIDAEFVCSDVYDACDALTGRSFDIVYTDIGALGWLPDLASGLGWWMDCFGPGGALYLVEIHPVVLGVLSDGRTLQQDIFEAPYVKWDEKGGTYAAPDAILVNTTTFERVHSLSEVMSAVLGTGLSIETVPRAVIYQCTWPWTVKGEDGFHRLPHGWPKYPLTYSVLARKPS